MDSGLYTVAGLPATIQYSPTVEPTKMDKEAQINPEQNEPTDLSMSHCSNERRSIKTVTMCFTWEEKAKWNQIQQSISSAFETVNLNVLLPEYGLFFAI